VTWAAILVKAEQRLVHDLIATRRADGGVLRRGVEADDRESAAGRASQ
jgi:hypothetical protein